MVKYIGGMTATTTPVRGAIVVHNYNPQAGFFWVMFNILHAGSIAEQLGLPVRVALDTGLYSNPNQPEYHPENWFCNYFDPPPNQALTTTLPLQVYRPSCADVMIAMHKEKRIPSEFQHRQQYEFDRRSYDVQIKFVKTQAKHTMMIHRQWKRLIRIKPFINKEVDSWFKRQHVLPSHLPTVQQYSPTSEVVWIGLQYRGTDKLPDKSSAEDGSIHFPYEFAIRQCRDWIQHHCVTNATTTFGLIACSDEQPFIDLVQHTKFPQQVKYIIATNAFRSPHSTSGFIQDTSMCSSRYQWNEPDQCRYYRQTAAWSIHRGKHEGISNFQIGKEVLIDVLLLAKCNVFFRMQGNVSNFPKYINPRLLEVNLVERWKEASVKSSMRPRTRHYNKMNSTKI